MMKEKNNTVKSSGGKAETISSCRIPTHFRCFERRLYRQVGMALVNGDYSVLAHHADITEYTHEGSIGNLCTEEIRKKMEQIIHNFHFPEE